MPGLSAASRRAGADWYELTHDRLVGPILVSAHQRSERRRQRIAGAGVSVLAAAVVILSRLPVTGAATNGPRCRDRRDPYGLAQPVACRHALQWLHAAEKGAKYRRHRCRGSPYPRRHGAPGRVTELRGPDLRRCKPSSTCPQRFGSIRCVKRRAQGLNHPAHN